MLACYRSAYGATPPPPVGGHTSVLWQTEQEDAILLFGGNADLSGGDPEQADRKNVLINSLYKFSPENMKWTKLKPEGKAPAPRYCHTSTVFEVAGTYRQVLVYGGFSANKPCGDTWLLLPGATVNDWTWVEIEEQETPPPPRYGHTVDVVSDKLIMFGGSTGAGGYLNDLYLLEVDDDVSIWREINTVGPSKRAYHASVYIQWEEHDCMVVFGGRTSDVTCVNDIYVLCFNFVENTVFWMQPDCAGQPPCPRYNHTMVAIENKIYVMGGRTINADGTKRTLDDLYMLNLDTLTWHRPSTGGLSPLPTRCWHSCTAVEGLMYVYGGYSDTTTFGDMHVLDSNARFKLPTRSNQSISNMKGFQASFTDLTQLGTSSLTSSDSRARLLGSQSSLSSVLGKKLVTQRSDVPALVLDLLRDCFLPIEHYNYEWDQPSHEWIGNKIQFLELLEPLCKQALKMFQKEPIMLAMSSPAYILGDIHGNFKDLMFFSRSFWNFGLKLCPASVLFLGDFVDRGPHSLEVIAYLLAIKVMHPKKVVLLRGNHEFRDVNGDIELYEGTSFKAQCIALAGTALGTSLWEAFNVCFDWMPLSCIINKKIFCVHGGVPRYTQANSSNLLHDIGAISRPLNEEALWLDQTNQMPFTFDLVWADPAEPEEERMLSEKNVMFGVNERGGNTATFSRSAVDEFFKKTGCSYLVRAHQRKDLGVEVAKGARILTVFSSSHYCFSEDMQVLTNEGFMFLRDIERHYDASLALRPSSKLLICSYSDERATYEYQRCERLIVNEAKQRSLVEFTNESEGVSLVATDDHDMYVRRGGSTGFSKVKAGRLCKEGGQAEFLALAANGLVEHQEMPFVVPLQLVTEQLVVAFVGLFAHWMTSGCPRELETPRSQWVAWMCANHHEGDGKLPAWCFALRGARARAFVEGYSGGTRGVLRTRTAQMRDQVERVALHAGYATRPRGTLLLHYEESVVGVRAEATRVPYAGRTWCVSVPNGLIVVRRAFLDTRGSVERTSRPTIQGNCGGHNSAAAVLVADDKVKVVIVQPFSQSIEPPETVQTYMEVGDEDPDTHKREWGNTNPEEDLIDDHGVSSPLIKEGTPKEEVPIDATRG